MAITRRLDNTFMPNDPTMAQLRRMAVHPSLQRRGIGRRLISHLLSHASLLHPDGLRIRTIELVTTGFQSSAVGIYESFGWKRVKTDLGAPGKWWLDWYAVHYKLELGDRYYDRVA
jgi:GNAT superfamily N-acetyltransferase